MQLIFTRTKKEHIQDRFYLKERDIFLLRAIGDEQKQKHDMVGACNLPIVPKHYHIHMKRATSAANLYNLVLNNNGANTWCDSCDVHLSDTSDYITRLCEK